MADEKVTFVPSEMITQAGGVRVRVPVQVVKIPVITVREETS